MDDRPSQCIDPCHRLPYCADGTLSANQDTNCTSYFGCLYGKWVEQHLGGIYFDPVKCVQSVSPKCTQCPDNKIDPGISTYIILYLIISN